MGCCCSKKKNESKNPVAKTLTEAEKAILMANTGFSSQEIDEWHAGFLRDTPSGQLNKKQFIKEYRRFYPKGEPDEFCQHVFRIFDSDKNGFIGNNSEYKIFT
jgi:Ca2+-binding EF-hand superfamily protein